MNRDQLIDAFQALGAQVPPHTEIVVGGGSALLLMGYRHRGTADCDVFFAEPSIYDLRRAISAVAEEMELSDAWLNDGPKGFVGILPEDSEDTFEEVGEYGNLRVRHLGRRNMILLKAAAVGRGNVDLEDLRILAPTDEEIQFIREELPRIAQVNSGWALALDLYLRQGELQNKSNPLRSPTQPGSQKPKRR